MKKRLEIFFLAFVAAAIPSHAAATTPIIFADSFSHRELLSEGESMAKSTDRSWWLNSGAYVFFNNFVATTVHGELAANDPLRLEYAASDPGETDLGYHPQNIFRLITRTKAQNFRQEAYFKIDRYIISPDEHRSESNGLLLFSHYVDSQNLYYAGIRVDGNAIIKKKQNGKYFTLASNQILAGSYDRDLSPNLLPMNSYVGLRSEIRNIDGKVMISLYLDQFNNGYWKLIANAVDDGKNIGPPIINKSYAGIRTDFMDVRIKKYSMIAI